MNYEEFSKEEQNVINQFRNLIENIKARKDCAKIHYSGFFLKNISVVETDSPLYLLYRNINDIIECYCFVNRIELHKRNNIFSFLHDKNYFLPTFSSFEDYQQNKHKYPFIEE